MEQEEPTMEEILASIRQILSGEENAHSPEKTEEPIVLDPPVKEEPTYVPPPVFEPKEKELPPVVAEPAPDAETQRVTFTAPTDENIITLTPAMLVVPEEVFEEKEEEVILPEDNEVTEDEQTSLPTVPTVPETVEQETTSIPKTNLSESGNDALTNLMAELLKPALKDWMNKNMTQVLEKLLQEELKNKNLS